MCAKMIGRLLTAVCLLFVLPAVYAAAASAQIHYIPSGRFGSKGSGAGQFNGPLGVAVDEKTDDVYVADYENKRIEKFDASGNYLSEINGSETPETAFVRPYVLAVDNSSDAAKGRLYVGDVNDVVYAFDASGKYAFQVPVKGDLRAIATDLSGHLWVWAETGPSESKFEEYSEAGTLIFSGPTIKEGAGSGIAVDSDGNVYVLDTAERVVRYSPPEFAGSNETELGKGTALAIDPATNKIFQDSQSAFQDSQSGVAVWPPFGEGPGLWQRREETIMFTDAPAFSGGLAVNGKNGVVYASAFEGNYIEIFKYLVSPDVSTGAASEVTTNSATLAGTVNPDNTETKYFIEWGETEAYGHTTVVQTGEGETPVAVNAELTGLEANTTYHYRVVAINENGTVNGSDATFTTVAVPAVVEGASTASDPTRSTVVLHATINTKHSSSTYHFRYVEEASYEPTATNPYSAGGVTADTTLSAISSGQTVEQLVSGLEPDTTYHYQLVVVDEVGVVLGADGTFTTGAATPPTATTGAASGVAQNSATISGTLDTSGLPTTYGFEIATSTDYGPPTGLGSIGPGLNGAGVSLALSGLQPGTTYHYRLTATNLDGTSYGADQTFTTSTFSSTFATPPAPLPFVETPTIVFPAETHATAKKSVKKKTKAGTKKKHKKKHKPSKHKNK